MQDKELKELAMKFINGQDDNNKDEFYMTDRELAIRIMERFLLSIGVKPFTVVAVKEEGVRTIIDRYKFAFRAHAAEKYDELLGKGYDLKLLDPDGEEVQNDLP